MFDSCSIYSVRRSFAGCSIDVRLDGVGFCGIAPHLGIAGGLLGDIVGASGTQCPQECLLNTTKFVAQVAWMQIPRFVFRFSHLF